MEINQAIVKEVLHKYLYKGIVVFFDIQGKFYPIDIYRFQRSVRLSVCHARRLMQVFLNKLLQDISEKPTGFVSGQTIYFGTFAKDTYS